jgi:hypothetical protein
MAPRTAASALALLLLLLGACVNAPPEAPQPRVVHAAPDPGLTHPAGKTLAPVRLSLETSGLDGELSARLRLEATAAIPRAVSRFVLPPGVKLLQGDLELDHGPLQPGDARVHALTLLVPPQTDQPLAAGVDAHLRPGATLHRGATAPLGRADAPPPKTQIIPMPDGDRARSQTVR